MQDGQNLFFPDEAFLGQDWKVDKTGDVLRAMNAVEDFLILGIYSGDRMTEYTKPGYELYARSLVEEVVPEVERRAVRAEGHRRYRSVWGSSLGVVSFYTVWEHPEVFGSAVCMSSTFSHRDDLIDRVFAEPFRDVGFYLDSGWPGDNYEVTVGMAMALISRGWEYGRNLLHLCFPMAGHSEAAWGTRLHLPLQFLNGAVARAYRVSRPVLGDRPFEHAPASRSTDRGPARNGRATRPVPSAPAKPHLGQPVLQGEILSARPVTGRSIAGGKTRAVNRISGSIVGWRKAVVRRADLD
jgi:predicted alpha/beta superfamily hydrolase